MLANLWGRVAGWLTAVGIALGILFAAYSKGRQDAAMSHEKRRADDMRKAREIEDEVSNLGAADIDVRLREWLRDKR